MRTFGASSAHEGMWRAQQLAPDTPNHALTMWDVDGELDAAVMESAFLHVMGEAEVLRVNFVDEGGEGGAGGEGGGLRLRTRELGDWRPFFLDLSDRDDPEQAAREELADLVREPFDLANDLLLRLGVVRLAPARSLLVIAYHHLVSDGYGAGGLLSKRLAEVYTALLRGQDVAPLPHPWDAESFAAEAVAYRSSEQFTEDSAFWRDYLTDAPAPAQVPRVALPDALRATLNEPLSSADRWSEVAGTIGMVSRTLTVPRAESDAWTEAAKASGIWMSQLLAGAAAVYFRHRCDRPEFLFSLAVGNRIGVASRTPGLAVNVVPVRVKAPLDASAADLADAIVDETYEISDHAACHYSDIQRASGTAMSGRGSYGAVLNVVEFAEQLHFGDSPASYSGATTGTFEELSIGVYADGSPDSDLFIRLDAPESLYDRAELRFIGEELIAYIRAVVADGERPVGALDLLAGADRERVLTAPDAAAPQGTVTGLFARQVQETPDAVALVSGESTVSYRELDERSDRLAAALRSRHVAPETVVAVALPRSVELAVALLAVAKAGAAHAPVDPASPADGIATLLADASAGALLTDVATAGALGDGLAVPVLVAADLAADATGAPESVPAYEDGLLAVVRGTSTTGADTAVGVTHRNVVRLAGQRAEAGRGGVLWHAPHASDAFALDLWVALLNGGRAVVAPAGDLDTDALQAPGLSAAWLPAGLFSAIAAQRPEGLAGLREVWTGGERVSAAALRRVREACPGLTVLDGHVTTDGSARYVLGPGLAPVPVGVTGELYVGGPGVTRGHPGRPGATAERFVPCPFGPPGSRMYRTGDRVRWSDDGRLEYVGRVGAQSDVRGIRVEWAEVEDALSEHTDLAQAAVDARPDDTGQQRLVAYVVAAAGRSVSADELRRFATGRLPEVMVPTVFTVLEALPVTADGRVDRAALPEPAFDDGTYRAPRNDTERTLATAFAEVLELERVGIDDDFFDLGGNSLRAIRLTGLIRAELNLEVSIRTLFAARTISGLSDMWADLGRSSRPKMRRRTREGAVL
ncbi:AMP-binding protein [Streptomyces sp. NPDC050085]|uniref:AMP-binding protein n=1 Tax=Streptomyces sp. NPDC050085 TaxID=3365600 RepID=UPI0037A21A17